MFWKYAMAALAGLLAGWLWRGRRGADAARSRRTGSLPTAGDEHLETVVEELVSAAEELMDDLRQRQGEIRGLLTEADERIASLRQALGHGSDSTPAACTPTMAPAVAPTAMPAPAAATVPAGPSEEKVQAAAALVASARLGQLAALAEVAAAKEAASVEAGATGPGAAPTPKAGRKKARRKPKARPAEAKAGRADEVRHQDVLVLAQRGLGAAEIARLTGRTTGEVQLILGLNRSLH